MDAGRTDAVRRTALLTASYLGTTGALVVVRGPAIPAWQWIVAGHIAACAALLAMRTRRSLPRALILALEWHPLVLFPLLYKEVELLARAIGDWRLTSIVPFVEAALFGGQPSLYLSERWPSVPLSEFLHLCYLGYVLFIPAVAAYWYTRGRRAAFHELVFLLAMVMYGSYLFFILFPVDSPYYRFDPLGPPLTGHVFFDLVREMSSRGGARGGAFPSAHASGAVTVWLVALRWQPRLAAVMAPFVAGLALATVYGRFHYAVDTLAGVGVACVVVGLYWSLTRTDESRLRGA